MDLKSIKAIGFDADDTLWENETYFREAEERFAAILSDFMPRQEIISHLFDVEIRNMPVYGYGIKAFVLSMLEAGITISQNKLQPAQVTAILDIGKVMLDKPVVLLNGVEKVLKTLSEHYRLIVATKGDLLDQERKLSRSGLSSYFHHIEVMSDKHPGAYLKLIHHLDIKPEEFVMIGNSMKSDVLPVEEIGGCGIHVPFHITWQHELVNGKIESERVFEVERLADVLDLFGLAQ